MREPTTWTRSALAPSVTPVLDHVDVRVAERRHRARLDPARGPRRRRPSARPRRCAPAWTPTSTSGWSIVPCALATTVTSSTVCAPYAMSPPVDMSARIERLLAEVRRALGARRAAWPVIFVPPTFGRRERSATLGVELALDDRARSRRSARSPSKSALPRGSTTLPTACADSVRELAAERGGCGSASPAIVPGSVSTEPLAVTAPPFATTTLRARVEPDVGAGRRRDDRAEVDVTHRELRVRLRAVARGRRRRRRRRSRDRARRCAFAASFGSSPCASAWTRDLLLDADLPEGGAHPLPGRVATVDDGVDLPAVHAARCAAVEMPATCAVERRRRRRCPCPVARRHREVRDDASVRVDGARKAARDEVDALEIGLDELRIVVRVRPTRSSRSASSGGAPASRPWTHACVRRDRRRIDADAARVRVLRLGRRRRSVRGERVRDAQLAGGIAVDRSVDVRRSRRRRR